MDANMGVLLTTFVMVLIMEMGDKTQLLVVALASKFRPVQVFVGILLATLGLNLLAVALGTAIGGIKVIQDSVRAAASLLFIFFGLLSLRKEESDSEESPGRPYKAVLGIALAFFLAECGDKTQLSTFSFAAMYPEQPLSVFAGASLGLLAADSLGLIAGTLVLRYVPKRTISVISAFLFIAFGFISGWTTLRYHFVLDMKTCILYTAVTAVVSLIAAAILLLTQKNNPH
jgi:putative Ca2+/H+ antiporter (TMEM165/GDT1 family)